MISHELPEVARRRKDGTVGYTTRIRIRRDKKLLYEEVMTFSRLTAARNWARCRDVELESPRALAKAQQGNTSLASVIRWYCFRRIPQVFAADLPPRRARRQARPFWINS